MTPTQYVAMFVRLFAIWLFFLGIQAVGAAAAVDALGLDRHTLSLYALAFLWFAVALTLWRFPMLVAKRLVPPANSNEARAVTALEIATVACIVLGLWLCAARAFPALVRYLAVVAVMIHDDIPLSSLDRKTVAALIESGLEFAAALFLVFRARTISHYLLARAAK